MYKDTPQYLSKIGMCRVYIKICLIVYIILLVDKYVIEVVQHRSSSNKPIITNRSHRYRQLVIKFKVFNAHNILHLYKQMELKHLRETLVKMVLEVCK